MIGSTRSRTGYGSGARVHRDDAGRGTFRGIVASALRSAQPGEEEAAPSVVGVRHGHRGDADGHVWQDADRRAARAVDRRGRQDARMAERFAARLPAPHPGRRRLDRRGLSRRDQYPPRATRVERGVCRAGRQGRGQPRLAQDEERLGRLECALARRRADRAADPRRDVARVGSTEKRPRSRCSSRSACAPTARKCCSRSRAWAQSEAAWRAPLDDLIRRGLRTPELVVVDGAPGLEKALAALWPDMAVQRCTVHKHATSSPMPLSACTRKSR